jgi:hypothetical protein
MVSIQKIWQNNTSQTGTSPGFDDGLKQHAQQTGALWSRTHGCWYHNYDTESYHTIMNEFPDHKVVNNQDAKIPAPAPGFHNSRDTAAIVEAPQACNALPLPVAVEHNSPPADAKVVAADILYVNCN